MPLKKCFLNRIKDYRGVIFSKLKEEDIVLGKIISWNIHNGYDFYNKDCLIDDIIYLVDEKAEYYLLQEVYDDILIKLLKENLCVKGEGNKVYKNGNLLICNSENFVLEVYEFESWEGRNRNNCIGCKTIISEK